MANPQPDRIAVTHDIDYQLAFDLAPIGLVLSRNRTMVNCNRRVCEMFGATREQLIGQSFQILYPSADEYERTGARIAPLLNRDGTYSDDRLMKRLDGRFRGEIFWCHVTGRALNRAGDQPPHRGNLPRPPDAQVPGQHHGRPGAQTDGRLKRSYFHSIP